MRFAPNCNEDNLIGFKIRIYPTPEQEQYLIRAIQVTRAIYNLGLEFQNKHRDETGHRYGEGEIERLFEEMRRSNQEYFWLKEVTNQMMRESLRRLDNAFEKAKNKQLPNRDPKFKSRKSEKQSITYRNDRCYIRGNYVHIEGMNSDKEYLAKNHNIPSGIRLYNPVVVYKNGKFWFCANYENYSATHIDIGNIEKSEPIGVDVGVVNMITTSNGEFYKFSDISKIQKKIKRLDKRLYRDEQEYLAIQQSTRTKYDDVPKSKNHYKRIAERQKLYEKIANKSKNDISVATKRIVNQNPSAIIIETISVKDQIKNRFISRYHPQVMYYEIHRQLMYKAKWRGIPVIKAPKDFASSHICSNCGKRGYFKHRTFCCSHCGYHEDRDLNAAYNLRDLAYQNPTSSEGLVLDIA